MSSSALADDEPPKTVHEWYGWQTILVDAASIAVMIGGVNHGGGAGPVVGLVGYTVGGPIVHVANGEGGRAGASLAVRVLLPAAGAALGYASYHKSTNPNAMDFGPGLDAAVLGFVGGLVACVIDAAAIARHDVPAEPITKKPNALSVVPQIGASPRGGVQAGVGGTF